MAFEMFKRAEPLKAKKSLVSCHTEISGGASCQHLAVSALLPHPHSIFVKCCLINWTQKDPRFHWSGIELRCSIYYHYIFFLFSMNFFLLLICYKIHFGVRKMGCVRRKPQKFPPYPLTFSLVWFLLRKKNWICLKKNGSSLPFFQTEIKNLWHIRRLGYYILCQRIQFFFLNENRSGEKINEGGG